ncbi:MAG: hypothetical protein ABSA11_08650 [Candidatus Bathyarchaeia archaeon]|jgi:hypothetical protein
MVDLVVLQSASYAATTIGVCVAAFYYVMTLRSQQNNMKATLRASSASLAITSVAELLLRNIKRL